VAGYQNSQPSRSFIPVKMIQTIRFDAPPPNEQILWHRVAALEKADRAGHTAIGGILPYIWLP
jgi:hypothetical protein